ncbi:ComEC/Rec2 family competence protein [Caproiciproducens sp. MSJ-32]|uniref:ComEC/Rec2 family competence protein n=1 Tax=Caproiciproducens sp. MSJ-32 TaxID=2841527 RepID=UPI001C10CA67|nr:ComEC/Rec2 family competence protein [Caproiciproducens sp. MSJ-32]MBU5453915.1 ComEC/Rec2 family competence protein [Caproiciproducens sp. MSJ-32]
MNYNYRINVLLYIFLSFICGTYIYVLFNESKWLATIIASCFFILLVLFNGIKFSLLVMIFFFVPIINSYNYYNINFSKDQEIRIESTKLYGAIGKIKGRTVYLSGNIKEISSGDRIKVKGTFKKDINRERGVLGSYKVESYKHLKSDLISKVYNLREKIFYNLRSKLGYRRAAIITSISFGYTEYLDNSDEMDMKKLGILHALSVSGLHMAIVYSIIKRFFGEKAAAILSVFYVIFTGAALATVRSYIMMLTTSFAMSFKRNYNPLAGLSLGGIIIILFKPYSIFNIGFQLSFLATLGIILFNKKINKKLYRMPKYIREGISICISSQIFTFPILVYSFKEFSIGFLFGNLIVLPLMNIIVVIGNLLLLFIKIKPLFNYLIFLSFYITRIIDVLTGILKGLSPNIIYLNENIAKFYCIIMITVYFYKKHLKRIIIFPLLLGLVYIFNLLYTPYPKIEYYQEGVISISYKTSKKLFYTKNNIEKEKFEKITMAKEEYNDFNSVNIGNKFKLKRYNNNLLLEGYNKKYLLKVSKDEIIGTYDIIDFKNGSFSKIVLIKDKIIPFY